MNKFDKKTTEKIISSAYKGCPESTCARLAGIHPNTLRSWLRKGEDGLEDAYQDFYEKFNAAIASAELEAIEFVKEAGDVKAVQWFLSTRFRESWGNQVKVDLSIEEKEKLLEEFLDLLEAKLDPDVFQLVVSALAES